MKKALLLETTRRGYFRITQRGLEVLKEGPPAIDVQFLDQFDEFKQFRKKRGKKTISRKRPKDMRKHLKKLWKVLTKI